MKKKEIIPIIVGCVILLSVVGLLIFKGFSSKQEVVTKETTQEQTAEEGIETDIVFAEDVKENENKPMFEDKRNFTEEELANDEEPEGAEVYELDESESPYTVYIENIDEMADKYNDMYNCFNLKYYIMVYLRNITGDIDERYVATLVDGSCKNDDNELILTVDATLDKYPDVILHIEYDKANQVFGINSSLGDYSLETLKKESKIDALKFDPDLDVGFNDSDISTVEDVE